MIAKRLAAVALSVSMMLSIVPLPTFAASEESGTIDGVKYIVDYDNDTIKFDWENKFSDYGSSVFRVAMQTDGGNWDSLGRDFDDYTEPLNVLYININTRVKDMFKNTLINYEFTDEEQKVNDKINWLYGGSVYYKDFNANPSAYLYEIDDTGNKLGINDAEWDSNTGRRKNSSARKWNADVIIFGIFDSGYNEDGKHADLSWEGYKQVRKFMVDGGGRLQDMTPFFIPPQFLKLA